MAGIWFLLKGHRPAQRMHVNKPSSHSVGWAYQPTRITALVAADAPWAFSRRGIWRDDIFVIFGRRSWANWPVIEVDTTETELDHISGGTCG